MAEKLSVMVVDDEMIVRESLYQWFIKAGHRAEKAASGLEAIEKVGQAPFDVLFVDLKMPGMGGLEVLREVKAAYPETVVVMITAYGSIDSAVEAIKCGASDYLLKPFKPDHLSLVLQKVASQREVNAQLNYLRGRLQERSRFENIIGQAKPMQAIFEMISDIAPTGSTVLIEGETGTGKELVAKAIHAKSPRARAPFVALNCGAMTETLLEGELFGHARGAFTGATQARKGYLEVASGGTLFLDEISEIGSKMQVDLLRVLEEKRIVRVGERDPIDVDFRLIAATRHNLNEAVAQGRFRQDFYYRINVISIHLPPLRERKDDIPLLVEHFLARYSQETNKRVDRVNPAGMNVLRQYDWPGNVRELENAVERAVVLAKSRTLGVSDFLFLKPEAEGHMKSRSLKDVERTHVERTLRECGWNVTEAARVLEINRVTLHKMIKRYDMQRPS